MFIKSRRLLLSYAIAVPVIAFIVYTLFLSASAPSTPPKASIITHPQSNHYLEQTTGHYSAQLTKPKTHPSNTSTSINLNDEIETAYSNSATVLLYEAADSRSNLMNAQVYSEFHSQLKEAIHQQAENTDYELLNNSALMDIGLKPNDVIISINGMTFAAIKEAFAAVDSIIAGPQTTIEIDRDGGYFKYSFELSPVAPQ